MQTSLHKPEDDFEGFELEAGLVDGHDVGDLYPSPTDDAIATEKLYDEEDER